MNWRAIADAADKYMVPWGGGQVTGGQRIDLLGREGEDLPNIWADLKRRWHGIRPRLFQRSAHFVKTCVGSGSLPVLERKTARALGKSSWKRNFGGLDAHKFEAWRVRPARALAPRRRARNIGGFCVDSWYQSASAGRWHGCAAKRLMVQVSPPRRGDWMSSRHDPLYRVI